MQIGFDSGSKNRELTNLQYVRGHESPDQGAYNHGPVAQPGRAPVSGIQEIW